MFEYKDMVKSLEDQRKFVAQFFEAWIEQVEKLFKSK